MPRRKKKQPYKPPIMNGDHGTGTQAAMAGTELEEVLTEDGRNPNRMARRRRRNQLDDMHKNKRLSQRQYQAGKAIQNAYGAVDALSSGSPLKEPVDSSKQPDKAIAAQCDKNSHLKYVMQRVPPAMRYVVEHVCWHNQPLHTADRGRRHGSAGANLKVALDLVANQLRY